MELLAMCHMILFLPFFALPVFWLFPFPIAMSIYVIILGLSILLYYKIFMAMRMDPLLGKEAMLGKIGIVIKDINPEGKIMYAAEIWSAYAKGKKFSVGDKVVIKDFWRMQVLVQEIPEKSR